MNMIVARIANYMDISKRRSIMNAFILSQFSPLLADMDILQ